MARRILGLLLGLYLIALGVIGFWPVPVDQSSRTSLQWVIDQLHAGGLSFVSYTTIEFTANIVLFIPLGILVAGLMKPGQRWVAFALTLAVSLVIELGQFLFLPERTASAWDLLANSLGGAIGVLIVVLISSVRARRH